MSRTRTLVIIGGGVLGSAIAYHAKRRLSDALRVMVLEALPDAGLATSLRNSGVLHAGIHSPLGGLKSSLSYEGHLAARDFAKMHSVPIRECGMLIVATVHDILTLAARRKAFGTVVTNTKMLGVPYEIASPWRLRELEPHIHGVGGLFLPSVSSVDGSVFAAALLSEAVRMGAHAYFETRVVAIEAQSNAYRIRTSGVEFRADAVVNAAGLYADKIAALAGFPSYRVRYIRGEYCEIAQPYEHLVGRFVYPVPVEGNTTKGMHFVKRPDGRLLFGCNSREVPSPDYYEEDKTPTEFFRNAAVRFVPELRNAEFRWSFSGIRPKLDAAHDADFLFAFDHAFPPFVNCIGYDSPGLSAAIAAGKHITDLLAPHLV